MLEFESSHMLNPLFMGKNQLFIGDKTSYLLSLLDYFVGWGSVCRTPMPIDYDLLVAMISCHHPFK